MEQFLQQLLERVDSSRRDLVQLSNNLDLIRMDLVTCIQSVGSQTPPPVPLTNSAPGVKIEEDHKPTLKTLNQSTVSKIKTERKKDVCNCPNFPGHSGNTPSGHHHHPKKTEIKQSIVDNEMPSIPSIPPNQVADLLTYPTGGGNGGSSSTSNTRPLHSSQVNQAISDNNLLSKGQVNINTDSDNTNQLVVCEGQEIVGQVSNEANNEGSEGDADADGDDETVIDTSGGYIEAEQNENEQESRSVVGEPSIVKRMHDDGRESNDEVNNRDVGVYDEVGEDNKVIRPGRKRPLDTTQSSTAPSTQISRSTNVNLESASNSGTNKRLAVGLSQSRPTFAQPTGALASDDDDDESSLNGQDDDSDDDDDDYNGEEEETDSNGDADTDEDDDEDGNLKPFLCPYEGCMKRYTRNSNLNRHVRLHTGERPFVCDRCGNSFTQKEHLNVHFLTHTTERPFVCGIFECNKTFKSKNDLHQHQRNVLHRSR